MENDYVIWNGYNIDEVEAFASESSFGFVVGSPHHNWRWWHTLWNKLQLRVKFLPEWWPSEDNTVLEIFPEPEDTPWHWTTARPGDVIYRDGTVK